MSSVIKFSQAALIGIHGTILVAKSEEYLNVVKISELLGASGHHVAKVMQRVKKGGFIKSLRGPTGGFKMAKDPAEISLLDIYQAVEGRVFKSEEPKTDIEKELNENLIKKLTQDFIDYLGKLKLSEAANLS